MRPSFHPRLINDVFSDPGLFIPFLFEKRALLFDLGDLNALSARDLLKITHVFVTHTHMDHFIGFDTLLRIFLGREKELHIFGPPGFFKHLEGKLAGYSWNLVGEYQTSLWLKVTEVHPDKTLMRSYACRDRFKAKGETIEEPFSGILLKEPAFHVEAALLDHRIPCLGLSLVERFYINIMKEGLSRLGLPVGPWLHLFKEALYKEEDPGKEFTVTWEESGAIIKEKRFILGDLAENIAKRSSGQKISYITDIIGNHENIEKAVKLVKNADHLFIEAAFLGCDREIARKKYHLTAMEAGKLAKTADVKDLTIFHFSPRYMGREAEIEREVWEVFR